MAMTSTNSFPWKALAVSAAVAATVAMVGGWFTDVGPWYRALNKPEFQPPNWVFGPAWTLLYALTAISAAIGWQHADPAERPRLVALFLINAVLNVAWSGLFFGAKRPDLAGIEITVLWASILVLIIWLRPISRTASHLLIPYLLWVTFATYLNWSIIRLNTST